MRVLLICASYSPRSSSPAFRTTYLAKYLEHLDNDVTVLTYSENFQLRLDKKDEKLIKNEVSNVSRINQIISINQKRNRNLKSIFYKYGLANFIFPDPHVKNVKKFYLKAKEIIIKKDIDLVITFSFPPSFHLIGYFLKKKFPKLIVGCDYGDIWYGAPHEEFKKVRVKKQVDFLIEKQIINKVDFVSLTTQNSIDFYKKIFKTDKFILTEMGHLLRVNKKSCLKIDSLKIIHAGRLYYPMRNPLPVINQIENSNLNLELNLFGSLDEFLQNKLKKINLSKVKIRTWIASDILEKEISSSDVLILFGNESNLQVPGKLYEYLSYRKPIIYIHNDLENDPVIDLVKNYNTVYLVSNNNVSNEFPSVIKEIVKSMTIYNFDSNYDDYYSWEKIAFRLNTNLNNIKK